MKIIKAIVPSGYIKGHLIADNIVTGTLTLSSAGVNLAATSGEILLAAGVDVTFANDDVNPAKLRFDGVAGYWETYGAITGWYHYIGVPTATLNELGVIIIGSDASAAICGMVATYAKNRVYIRTGALGFPESVIDMQVVDFGGVYFQCIEITADKLFPNATTDLGDATKPFRHLYLSGNISDGTNALTVANAKTAFNLSHARSHEHSVAGDGTRLNPAEFNLPVAASASPVDGDAYWANGSGGVAKLYIYNGFSSSWNTITVD